jgi:hypothetical protein
MPLEFALRPRFNLERPVPRRRAVRRRWLRFALPVAAYWLAIAGVTHAFLRSTAGERVNDDTGVTEPSGAVEASAEVEETPSHVPPAPASDPGPALTAPAPPEPAFEPATLPVATSEDVPAPKLAEAPAPRVTEHARVTPRAPLLPPKEPLTVAQSEPHVAHPVTPPPPLEEPPAPRTEIHAPAATNDSPRDDARAGAMPSCESAAAASNETMDLRGARGGPDLTRDAFAAVLENGAYLNRCEIPARTALEICAAVQDGKVVGVTVASEPRSPSINACVRRVVAGLRFPSNSRLDITRTHFASAR